MIKKKTKIYKEGMQAGAKPFQDKFEKTTSQIKETAKNINKIAKNQKKSQGIISEVVDGFQKIDLNLKETQKNVYENIKLSKKQKKTISDMECRIDSINDICKFCGKPITSHQIVCSECGNISNVLPYNLKNFDIKDKCLLEASILSKVIQNSNEKDDDWLYPELNEKFLRMKKIQSIAYDSMNKKNANNSSVYEEIYKLTKKFFEEYKKKKIEIAVVGTVKAGKSSLINALIGKKLASVEPTPETSILVKYRTTKEDNYLNIKFYSKKEWDKLWSTTKEATVFIEEYKKVGAESVKNNYLGKKEEKIYCTSEELPKVIMEWTKSDSAKHFFVKEIEVGYKSETLPHDIYLVDTPGLSDPVRYRSDITREYIKKSDWILACITSEKLSEQPEFHFLAKVIENKNGDVGKIFVVATKKDMLVENERNAKRDEFLKRLADLYGNNIDLAVSRFSFISAECHIMSKKLILGETLSDDERKKMRKMLADLDMEIGDFSEDSSKVIKYAGVETLFHKIEDTVLKDRRSKIISEIESDYDRYMDVINTSANQYINDKKDFFDDLVSENQEEFNKIEQLEESNKELYKLTEKIRLLKKQLEDEINKNGIR